MMNLSFTNMPAPFLPINYYPIRTSIAGYDMSRNYFPQSYLNSDTMKPLNQSLVGNYLGYFTSTLLDKENMNVKLESKSEELNQDNLNPVENDSFCKLEADNDSEAPKSTKTKESSPKELKSKNEVHKQFQTEPKKKFWLPAEDALVLDLMKVYGQKWTKISTFLQDRRGKQVRDRYLNHLRPTIDQRDWSDEEDGLLRKLAVELGHKWTVIAAKLDGRTENQVKNRYHALLRRDKREVHLKRKICKAEPKLENSNESDYNYEELVFQPKIESNLNCGSKEDPNKSENESWDYAFQPLRFHSNIKTENIEPSLNSADYHESGEIRNFLEIKYSSNSLTKRQIMKKEEEESYSGLPGKKIKFNHNLSFNEASDGKEEFL